MAMLASQIRSVERQVTALEAQKKSLEDKIAKESKVKSDFEKAEATIKEYEGKGIRIWRDYKRRGETHKYYLKDGNVSYLGKHWNDRIRSLEVDKGIDVYLYKDSRFRSSKYLFSSGSYWEGKSGASSIKLRYSTEGFKAVMAARISQARAKIELKAISESKAKLPNVTKSLISLKEKRIELQNYEDMGEHDAGDESRVIWTRAGRNEAEVLLRGLPVFRSGPGSYGTQSKEGFNLVEINRYHGTEERSVIIEKSKGDAVGDELLQFMEKVAEKHIVVVACRGDLNDIFKNPQVHKALHLIGATKFPQEDDDEENITFSYTAIGFKGAKPGMAIEHVDENTDVEERLVFSPTYLQKSVFSKFIPSQGLMVAGSACRSAGDFAYVRVRGSAVIGDDAETEASPGINAVALESSNGGIMSMEVFQTQEQTSESVRLANWLLGLPEGAYFALAARGEAAKAMNRLCTNVVCSFGSDDPVKLQGSYSVIGYIDGHGAPRALSERSSATKSVEARKTFVEEDSVWNGNEEEDLARNEIDIVARSGPWTGEVNDSASITLNGRVIVGPAPSGAAVKSNRGLNVVAIDSSSGEILKVGNYDTVRSDDAGFWFSKYVQSLPRDAIVAIATGGDVMKKMSESGKSAMLNLGAQSFGKLQKGHGFAMVGRVGAAVGSISEDDDNIYGAEARSLLRLEATRSASNQTFNGYLKLSARSGGLVSGDHAYIAMDEEIIVAPEMDDPEVVMDDGLNIAAFDPRNGDLLDADNFNVGSSKEAGARMVQFIDSLPEGVLVAVAAMGETNFSSLTDDQKRALASIGAREIVKVNDNGSYASIGRKGEAESADLPDSFSNRSSVAVTHLIEPRIAKPLSNDVFLTVEAAGEATGAKYAQIKVNGKAVAGGVIAEGEEDEQKQEMLHVKMAAEQAVVGTDDLLPQQMLLQTTLDEPAGMREEDELDKIAFEEEPETTMNVVALSSDNGKVIGKLEFKSDVAMMETYVKQFTAFFNELPTGTFICLACRGSAIDLLPPEAKAMLGSIGATLYTHVTADSSYCVIGQKGGRPGSALEDLEQDLFTDENGVAPPAKVVHSFTPRRVPYSLTVQAAPRGEGEENAKESAIITLDHMKVLSTAEGATCTPSKGMNVVVIGNYGALRRSDCFDINQPGEAGQEEQDRLEKVIRTALSNEILAFALVGNLSIPSISPSLVDAMKKELGLEEFAELVGGSADEKEAYAAIGVKWDTSQSSERITKETDVFALSSYQWYAPDPEQWEEEGEEQPQIEASALMSVFHRADTEDEDKIIQGRCYRATLSADLGEIFTLEITADEPCTALINRKWYPLGPQRPAIVESNEGSKVDLMIELEEDDMSGPELMYKHYGSKDAPMALSLAGAAGSEKFVKNLDMQRLHDAQDPVSGKKVVVEGTTSDQLTAAGQAIKVLTSSSEADRASNPVDSSTTKPAKMIEPKGSFLVGLEGAKQPGGVVNSQLLPENLGIGTVRNQETKKMEVTMYSRTSVDTVETAARSHRTDLVKARGFLKKAKRKVSRGFKKAKSFASKSFKKVGKDLKKGWNTVKNIAVVTGKAIVKGAKVIYEKAKMVVEVAVDGLVKAFEVVMDKVIGPAVRGMYSVLSFVMDTLGSTMGFLMGWAMEILGGLIGMAPSDILKKRDILVEKTVDNIPRTIELARVEMKAMHKAAAAGIDTLRDALGVPSDEDDKPVDSHQQKEPQEKSGYVDEQSGQESNTEPNRNWLMDKFMEGIEKILGAAPPNLTHTANAMLNLFMGTLEDIGGLVTKVIEAFGKIISKLLNPKKIKFGDIKLALLPIAEMFVDLIDNRLDDLLGPDGLFDAILKDAYEMVRWIQEVRPNIPSFTSFYKAFFRLKQGPSFLEILMTLPAVVWCIMEVGSRFLGKIFGRGLNQANLSIVNRDLSPQLANGKANHMANGTSTEPHEAEQTVVTARVSEKQEEGIAVGFIVFGVLRLVRTALRLIFTELVAIPPSGDDDDLEWEFKHKLSVLILGVAWVVDMGSYIFNHTVAKIADKELGRPLGIFLQQTFGTALVMTAVYVADQRFKAGRENAMSVRKAMIAFAAVGGLLRVNIYFWSMTPKKTAKIIISYIISTWLNLAIFVQQAAPAAMVKAMGPWLKRQRQIAELGFGVTSSILMWIGLNNIEEQLNSATE